MSDFERVEIDQTQFALVEQRLNGLRAQMQIITERLGPVDVNKSIQQALEKGLKSLELEITKWLSIQNESIIAGLTLVAEAISKGLPPPPGPPAKVEFVKLVFPGLKESE